MENAEFLTTAMVRLHRAAAAVLEGRAGQDQGYLEDYALVGDGLLGLYEATFERDGSTNRGASPTRRSRLFWDEGREIFFDTGGDQEALVIRPRNLFDNAVPSGIAAAIDWLLRLGLFFDESRYESARAQGVAPPGGRAWDATRQDSADYLGALDFHLGPTAEIAVVWPSVSARQQRRFLAGEVAFGRYLPNKVVAGAAEGAAASAGFACSSRPRHGGGKPTAYLCRRYVCQAPVTAPDDLARQLDAGV